MRLLVLVLLLAATALVVAQSSLPAGVPIVFADGTTISAGSAATGRGRDSGSVRERRPDSRC